MRTSLVAATEALSKGALRYSHHVYSDLRSVDAESLAATTSSIMKVYSVLTQY